MLRIHYSNCNPGILNSLWMSGIVFRAEVAVSILSSQLRTFGSELSAPQITAYGLSSQG